MLSCSSPTQDVRAQGEFQGQQDNVEYEKRSISYERNQEEKRLASLPGRSRRSKPIAPTLIRIPLTTISLAITGMQSKSL
jgi:hypothetical protein